ncbi:MAG: bifunctional folylpolyglutamate synthase/dihydrofolate synthase [Winogradskyella sp.]|uniref:bifunctional folylpolyglutamate synthase/dihydrofolate synthase n=1 Tax=Winogradskyella sp. TaxID=1883156 RepID=UPI000F3BCBCE|nr:folylpolyglutamate synthase/dihydrofolate synthase family protein [Winogradskyella sp.]RNC83439.1 MAG: bifunctional folylpolyglutamate synthase/dihydrofolate synthase [Winogradskyella sp.]
MNYRDTVNWLFRQLPMYQNQGKSAYKKDLSNTIKLAAYLNNPELKFKSIHVAGTNGKGSCSHMLASIFQKAGYKVGLYTSPHLKDYRERIKINGKAISKHYVMGFVKKHKSFFEEYSLSFFEMTVGLAFDYFANKKVDVAIIEVGLGGRLDSTNIINPELSIITNIGLDHVQFLGNTKPKIASEKAGIIKKNIPVVIGETHPETSEVFIEKAKAQDSEIYFADRLIKNAPPSDLRGSYQNSNIKTVLQSVKLLQQQGYKISDEAIKSGLLSVVENTGLLGRWQVVSQKPKIIFDTAHNKEGLTYTIEQLLDELQGQLYIVFGMVNDKNSDEIISMLPKDANYYLAKPNIKRGLEVEKLAAAFGKFNLNYTTYTSISDAYKQAKSFAKAQDIIYVGGSTFVVAEVL